MSTTFNLTHESLDRLVKWFKGTSEGLTGVNCVSHSQILNKLEAALIESKFVYAITLRYPITSIEASAVKWMIKNVKPTPEQLNDFHTLLGYSDEIVLRGIKEA